MTTLPFLCMAYAWAHRNPSLMLVALFGGCGFFFSLCYDSLTAWTWISGFFLVFVVDHSYCLAPLFSCLLYDVLYMAFSLLDSYHFILAHFWTGQCLGPLCRHPLGLVNGALGLENTSGTRPKHVLSLFS